MAVRVVAAEAVCVAVKPSAAPPAPVEVAVPAVVAAGRLEGVAPAGGLNVGVGQAVVVPGRLVGVAGEAVALVEAKRLAKPAYRAAARGLVVLRQGALGQVGRVASPAKPCRPAVAGSPPARRPPTVVEGLGLKRRRRL